MGGCRLGTCGRCVEGYSPIVDLVGARERPNPSTGGKEGLELGQNLTLVRWEGGERTRVRFSQNIMSRCQSTYLIAQGAL
jgi:hypothetical protein